MTAGGYAHCIYKRSALKAADAMAKRLGAEAIVVADDIKQISAQKLTNLGVIDEACELPVLMPLVGFSSAEIGRQFKVKLLSRSIEECPFPPPRGIMDLEKVRELEERIKIDALVEESLSKVKIIKSR